MGSEDLFDIEGIIRHKVEEILKILPSSWVSRLEPITAIKDYSDNREVLFNDLLEEFVQDILTYFIEGNSKNTKDNIYDKGDELVNNIEGSERSEEDVNRKEKINSKDDGAFHSLRRSESIEPLHEFEEKYNPNDPSIENSMTDSNILIEDILKEPEFEEIKKRMENLLTQYLSNLPKGMGETDDFTIIYAILDIPMELVKRMK